jgi:tRNA(adenine34) deaminase
MLAPVHEVYMREALQAARRAAEQGEVPIGAVLVAGGRVLASDFNRPITSCDPTAHAEILALRSAGAMLGNYRMPDTALYVTVEPCLMCMGAIVNARVPTLVYGADEPKFGAVRSLVDFAAIKTNHRVEIVSGVLEGECRSLLLEFFRSRREKG